MRASSTCRKARWRARRTWLLSTYAGPEIGVASTKAFTTQLTVLACLALAVGRARGTIDQAREARALSTALIEVPARAAEVLNHDERSRELAPDVAEARDVLYLGRGTGYPIALEGALKLKEISYIHAEGYAAGEMKHGPIALIDETVPVIVIAPSDELFDKTASNMQEVVARGGQVIFLSDAARASSGSATSRRRRSSCRRSIRSWRRSSTPSRCSCSPITSRCSRAPTSTSRATSRRA